MKRSLTTFITSILSSLDIEDMFPFTVYETEKETLPGFTDELQIPAEFLVCCDCSIVDSYTEIKEKIQRFLGKDIYLYENEKEIYLYWFEGETIAPSIEKGNDDFEEEINYLKTHTILPHWLDEFIFKQLDAQYAPDYQRYHSNLQSTEDENKVYLGTYFPRSYAEAFCIFQNIFQKRTYKENKTSKDILNILSIGCGTGGDLIGLLTALEKYDIGKEIHILAIDGNADALDILNRVITKLQDITSKKIVMETIRHDFHALQNLYTLLTDINLPVFDFILSFKILNEILSNSDNVYYDCGKICLPLLAHDGLCTLLDVTTKDKECNQYLPVIKNTQLNSLLRESDEFKTLLPLPCYKYAVECMEECFTQQKFSISHTRKTNDLSKVTYRVIGRKDFVNKMLKEQDDAMYVLQRNQAEIVSFCPLSEGEKIEDAYTL